MTEPMELFCRRVAYERARLTTMVAATKQDHSLVEALERQRSFGDVEADSMDSVVSRLALTGTELQILWFAVAHRIDPEVSKLASAVFPEGAFGLTTRLLRDFVFGDRWSPAAMR